MLTRIEIVMKLAHVNTTAEAMKYIKMLYPDMTEQDLQKWAKEIISIT